MQLIWCKLASTIFFGFVPLNFKMSRFFVIAVVSQSKPLFETNLLRKHNGVWSQNI